MTQGIWQGSRKWTRWLILLALVAAVNGVAVGWAWADQSVALDEAAQPSVPSGPMQTVVVHAQDFEGTTFPPAGWMVVDAEAYQQGLPPQYVWSRETCDVHPGRGGSAAAWAIGDGALGAALPCGGPYPDIIDSWMVYAGIDATGFDGGLQVTLDYKLDEPRQQSFLVCAWADGPGHTCFASPVTNTGWTSFGPMHFPHVAGHDEVEFWVLYRDREPQGTNTSVFVDNIVIEGVSSAMTSTPTLTPLPTTPAPPPTTGPTMTNTLTASPSPTGTIVPPTVQPSATVTTMPSITPSSTVSPSTTVNPSTTAVHTSTPTHTPSTLPSPMASSTPTASQVATIQPSATHTGVVPSATPQQTGQPTEPSATPTGTLGPTLPPPLTSVPTETEPAITPEATSTDAPTSETPMQNWRIYVPYVAKGA